jgi:putative colanic acid biosynthesis acetyltransferase WcaF
MTAGRMSPLDARLTRPLEGGPSFPLRHRLYRAGWIVAWTLLARWTPPPLHGWRRLVLTLFGARLARGARVYGTARVWYPPNLTMGSHSVIGPHASCYCMDRVTIGAFAVISQGAQLCGGTHLVDSPDFQLVTRPIAIAAHAWIAADAFVGPGVSVGEGAVLGARAVAFRDLEPWTIYAGNPARPLRTRQWRV